MHPPLLPRSALRPADGLLQPQGLLPAVALPTPGAGAPSGQPTQPTPPLGYCSSRPLLLPQEMAGHALRVGSAAAAAHQPDLVCGLLAECALWWGPLLPAASLFVCCSFWLLQLTWYPRQDRIMRSRPCQPAAFGALLGSSLLEREMSTGACHISWAMCVQFHAGVQGICSGCASRSS